MVVGRGIGNRVHDCVFLHDFQRNKDASLLSGSKGTHGSFCTTMFRLNY